MRFEKREDCYLDTETGLEWSLGNYGPMTWEEAIKFCTGLGDGWRLPTMQELLSLVDYSRYNPATELPGMVSSSYWSSTTYAGSTDSAWVVYFNYGDDYWGDKSYNYYVRAVRGTLRYQVENDKPNGNERMKYADNIEKLPSHDKFAHTSHPLTGLPSHRVLPDSDA